MAMSSSDEYAASDEDSEPKTFEYRPSKSGKTLLDMFSRQLELKLLNNQNSRVRGLQGKDRTTRDMRDHEERLILPEKTTPRRLPHLHVGQVSKTFTS